MRWPVLFAFVVASRAALACPTLPEATEWWAEEVAPQCGSHPFHDAFALLDAPNICGGPCPRVCQVKRGDDHVSTVTYDTSGRWIGTAPLLNGYAGSSESCSYDADGHRDRCTKRYTPTLGSSPAITRDRAGRVVAITDDENTATFRYDRRGRVVGAADTSGRWTYRYDARGRLASEVLVTPRSTVKRTVTTYRYDRAGRLVERRSPDERTTFTYAESRLVEQTSTVGLRRMAGPETHVVRFTYDAQGRPLTAGNLAFEYCAP